MSKEVSQSVASNDSSSSINEESSSKAPIGDYRFGLQPARQPHFVHIGTSSENGNVDFRVNKYFKSKGDLLDKMSKWALEWKFEYRTRWSNKTRVILGCVDKQCTWKMSASKMENSDYFVVKHFVHDHTCDTTHRNANHHQASSRVLASLISSNYAEKKDGLRPKQIIDLVKLSHGVQIIYKKAWRTKEFAQNLVRGTPEDSYHNLAKWLFKLQEKNQGSVVYLEKDAKGKFKYTFVSFGAALRGFSLMRRVIAVDGIFLKGKFMGTLLGACAQDGGFHLYPLAFGIVDSENEDVWSWFFRGLKIVILDAEDLVFISDRAPSIAKALSVVYPLAHHGICRVHLIRNIKTKFGKKGLIPLVEAAANAYTLYEFTEIFREIQSKNPSLATYLEDADFRKWSRAHAPKNRYNIMTTNIAESLNSLLNVPRELPVISLPETIRMTLTSWFQERREKTAKHNKYATPKVVQKIVDRYDSAMTLDVYQVDENEFEVRENSHKHVVNLKKKDCTCYVFNIDRIPCIHAIAVAKRTRRDENKLVDEFYTTETWSKAYYESIHPCGDLSTCNYPEVVYQNLCLPPLTKKSSGRPPKKRKRSAGDFGVPNSKAKGHKCGRCGHGGHNKTTCKNQI